MKRAAKPASLPAQPGYLEPTRSAPRRSATHRASTTSEAGPTARMVALLIDELRYGTDVSQPRS